MNSHSHYCTDWHWPLPGRAHRTHPSVGVHCKGSFYSPNTFESSLALRTVPDRNWRNPSHRLHSKMLHCIGWNNRLYHLGTCCSPYFPLGWQNEKFEYRLRISHWTRNLPNRMSPFLSHIKSIISGKAWLTALNTKTSSSSPHLRISLNSGSTHCKVLRSLGQYLGKK